MNTSITKRDNIMKKYYVEITETNRLTKSESTSILCNNKGKTIVCRSTAKKWAKNYETMINSKVHIFIDTLITIKEYH